MLHVLQLTLVLIFPALVVTGGLRDLTSFIIPNWISLALVAGFALAAPACGLAAAEIGLCFAVGAAALVIGMGMFAAGWIGGGDAKLLAAAALWLGWPASLSFMVFVGLAGGALAMGLLSLRSGWVRPFLPAGPRWFGRLVEPKGDVPYGVAIAAGALAAFPASPIMRAAGIW